MGGPFCRAGCSIVTFNYVLDGRTEISKNGAPTYANETRGFIYLTPPSSQRPFFLLASKSNSSDPVQAAEEGTANKGDDSMREGSKLEAGAEGGPAGSKAEEAVVASVPGAAAPTVAGN